MIMSGSIDNTVRIWDIKGNKCIHVISDHSHFVQGVAWDPLGKYLASQSCDRSVIVYSYDIGKNGFTTKVVSKIAKLENKKTEDPAGNPPPSPSPSHLATGSAAELMPPPSPKPRTMPSPNITRPASPAPARSASPAPKTTSKAMRMYIDETLTSFFRRLSFLPDGSMLLTPASQIKVGIKDEKDDFANTVYLYARGRITGYLLILLIVF